MSCWYFRRSFVNCCPSPLLPGLTLPPPLLSYVNMYTVYTCTVCKGRGVWVLGLGKTNTCRKVPLEVIFLDDDILLCLLNMILIFSLSICYLRLYPSGFLAHLLPLLAIYFVLPAHVACLTPGGKVPVARGCISGQLFA